MSRLLTKQARFQPANIGPDTAERTNGDGWRIIQRRDFRGGENRNVLPEMVAENEALLLENCVIRADGLPETREGKTILNTASLGVGAVTSIHRFTKDDGSKFLVVQHGTSLYGVSWDGSSVIASFGTAIATGLNAAKFRSVVWKDTLWLTNGVDVPKKITVSGSTFTVAAIGGSPPSYKFIKQYGSRLWLIGGNFIRFSDLEDGETWDALNIIKVRDGDGDEITGFSPQDGGVVIFKNNSAWPMYGTSLTDLRIGTDPLKFVSGSAQVIVGCIAPDTVLDDGIFLGIDNLYQFNITGGQAFKPTHVPLLESWSLDNRRAAVAVSDPLQKRAVLHVPGSGTLCIDGKFNGAITSWTNIDAKSLCVASAKDDPFSLLIGDQTNGVIYTNDGGDDNGTEIQTTITTAYEEYGSIGEKVFRAFMPEVETFTTGAVSMEMYSSSSVELDRDGIEQQSQQAPSPLNLIWDSGNWGEKLWSASERIKPVFWLNHLRGFLCSHKFVAHGRIRYLGHRTKLIEVGYQ